MCDSLIWNHGWGGIEQNLWNFKKSFWKSLVKIFAFVFHCRKSLSSLFSSDLQGSQSPIWQKLKTHAFRLVSFKASQKTISPSEFFPIERENGPISSNKILFYLNFLIIFSGSLWPVSALLTDIIDYHFLYSFFCKQ